MVEDRAAKDFRSAVREKIEYKEQHQSSAFAYITSAAAGADRIGDWDHNG